MTRNLGTKSKFSTWIAAIFSDRALRPDVITGLLSTMQHSACPPPSRSHKFIYLYSPADGAAQLLTGLASTEVCQCREGSGLSCVAPGDPLGPVCSDCSFGSRSETPRPVGINDSHSQGAFPKFFPLHTDCHAMSYNMQLALRSCSSRLHFKQELKSPNCLFLKKTTIKKCSGA